MSEFYSLTGDIDFCSSNIKAIDSRRTFILFSISSLCPYSRLSFFLGRDTLSAMLTKFQGSNVFIYRIHLTLALKGKSFFMGELEEHEESLKLETRILHIERIIASLFKYNPRLLSKLFIGGCMEKVSICWENKEITACIRVIINCNSFVYQLVICRRVI